MNWEEKDVKNLEPIILEPEDWSKKEWETLCKLFNVDSKNTTVIDFEIKRLVVFNND